MQRQPQTLFDDFTLLLFKCCAFKRYSRQNGRAYVDGFPLHLLTQVDQDPSALVGDVLLARLSCSLQSQRLEASTSPAKHSRETALRYLICPSHHLALEWTIPFVLVVGIQAKLKVAERSRNTRGAASLKTSVRGFATFKLSLS